MLFRSLDDSGSMDMSTDEASGDYDFGLDDSAFGDIHESENDMLIRQAEEGELDDDELLANDEDKGKKKGKKEKKYLSAYCTNLTDKAKNGELDVIENMINGVFPMLNPGGRIAVITFHSLEDRIVKQTFAELAKGCECPPDFPVCVCGKQPKGRVITKKPVLPSEKELEENPRSRSAKLRIFEKNKE